MDDVIIDDVGSLMLPSMPPLSSNDDDDAKTLSPVRMIILSEEDR